MLLNLTLVIFVVCRSLLCRVMLSEMTAAYASPMQNPLRLCRQPLRESMALSSPLSLMLSLLNLGLQNLQFADYVRHGKFRDCFNNLVGKYLWTLVCGAGNKFLHVILFNFYIGKYLFRCLILSFLRIYVTSNDVFTRWKTKYEDLCSIVLQSDYTLERSYD